ncbi:MAG: group II truncated hemoglobin [Bacteriovoracaceae bacterium]|nr:group II truncated hemoglobin [Bacteriovoracaceae bacterium]
METTPYQIIGEEPGLRKLVNHFYDHMDTNPKMKPLRDIHKGDLNEINEKLFEFLSGWFGGPDLYIKKYGHPRMRGRHLPFPIGKIERDQWLVCMRVAMDQMNIEKSWDEQIFMSFYKFATHMINKQEQENIPNEQ